MANNPYERLVEKNPYEGMTASEMPAPPMLGMPARPSSPEKALEYMKAHSFGSGIPRLAYDIGGWVTDKAAGSLPPEVAGGLGFLTNIFTQAAPSLLTSANTVGQAAPSLTTGPSKWLLQTAVKPGVDDLVSGSADKALKTMLDESIAPTMSGWGLKDMVKVGKETAKLDDQVGNLIAGSQAQVSVPNVASRLNPTLEKATTQVNPKADMRAVEDAWTEFLTSPHVAGRQQIPVQLAHQLKRGTYKTLGDKSYGEVGSTSVEAQKALARGLREETMEAVPEIKHLLARQADLMNVRDVAGNRALLDANKNPAGLAALRIDHPLSSLGFLADRWGWLKSLLAMGLYRGGQAQTIVPIGLASQAEAPRGDLYSP